MKLGLIVECTVQGLEVIVCPKILELLAKETRIPIEHQIVPMTNKDLLILGAAERVRLLLGEGCDRVVILWDENPPWTPEKKFAVERCWHTERQQLLDSLNAVPVDLRKIGLVCIEREFETWLLHDHHLLEKVIPIGTRTVKVKRFSNPVAIDRPKTTLENLYDKHHFRFNAAVAAVKIKKHLESLDRLKLCDTFRYFVQELLGNMPKGWKPYVYRPKGPRKKAGKK